MAPDDVTATASDASGPGSGAAADPPRTDLPDDGRWRQALAGLPSRFARLLEAGRREGAAPVIAGADVIAVLQDSATNVDGLMTALLPAAACHALAPLTRIYIGAVVQGASGALYLGANLSFAASLWKFCVHAEQVATINAWMHGETALRALATSTSPCGHCRQFLLEFVAEHDLMILVDGTRPVALADLLPAPFGPGNRGVARDGPMVRGRRRLDCGAGALDALGDAALAAAECAYAPYSGMQSGIALRTRRGGQYHGALVENAGVNPGLSPVEVALTMLSLAGEQAADICEAVLIETAGPASQRGVCELVLAELCGVRPRYLCARPL